MVYAAWVSCLLAAAPTHRAKLLVLDLAAAGGVESEVAGALTEAVTTELTNAVALNANFVEIFQTWQGVVAKDGGVAFLQSVSDALHATACCAP